MTSAPGVVFHFNRENRLEEAIVGLGGVTTTYLYDADGWRVRKARAGSPVSLGP